MQRFCLLSPALILLPILALACNSGEEPAPIPTATAQAATATRPPATNPPQPGATPTLPPVEGTIDPLGFGSTDPVTVKANPDPPVGVSLLTALRTGAHPEQGGWDRIVFEFQGSLPYADIRYVPAVMQCGSGAPVQVTGTNILLVRLQPANAHTEAGQPTLPSQTIPGPGNAVLQGRSACDFEAHVDWAFGIKGMQRFKVTTLTNPSRLVIDVKW
jgi:hypothetical protein